MFLLSESLCIGGHGKGLWGGVCRGEFFPRPDKGRQSAQWGQVLDWKYCGIAISLGNVGGLFPMDTWQMRQPVGAEGASGLRPVSYAPLSPSWQSSVNVGRLGSIAATQYDRQRQGSGPAADQRQALPCRISPAAEGGGGYCVDAIRSAAIYHVRGGQHRGGGPPGRAGPSPAACGGPPTPNPTEHMTLRRKPDFLGIFGQKSSRGPSRAAPRMAGSR